MKKKYKYKVSISRYGGEHTIGTIPTKVANWWLENQTADEFEEYILSNFDLVTLTFVIWVDKKCS